MKAQVTNSAPCKLSKGELRRIPKNPRSWPIGYHVGCPRCGFVTMAVVGKDGLEIDESVDGRVTFSKPLRCAYCQVLIHLNRCELTLEEDENVRQVRYR